MSTSRNYEPSPFCQRRAAKAASTPQEPAPCGTCTLALEIAQLSLKLGSRKLLHDELSAQRKQIDSLRLEQSASTAILHDLRARLLPVPIAQATEVRERLIDALLLARSGFASGEQNGTAAAGTDLRVEALLRDTLAIAFGVKEVEPVEFEPGRVKAERTENTDDPALHLSIAEVLAPAYLIESQDGDAPTVIRSARAVVRVHHVTKNHGEQDEA